MKKAAIICLFLAGLACLLLWFFTSHSTHTGLVLVQSCASADSTWQTTTRIAGDNARIDVRNVTSTLFNLANGDTTVITHPSKTFTVFSMPQMVARTKAYMQETSSNAEPPPISDTGRTEKIGNYTTSIYIAQTPAAKYTCWVTKDYPGYAALNAQLKKYRTMEKAGNLYPDLSTINGMVVKSEIALTSGKTVTVSLLTASIEPIRDSEFVAPEDYTQLPPPALPVIAPASPSPAPSP